jgi:hypothetical protein
MKARCGAQAKVEPALEGSSDGCREDLAPSKGRARNEANCKVRWKVLLPR